MTDGDLRNYMELAEQRRVRIAELERERDYLLSAVGASMDDIRLMAAEAEVQRLREALEKIEASAAYNSFIKRAALAALSEEPRT